MLQSPLRTDVNGADTGNRDNPIALAFIAKYGHRPRLLDLFSGAGGASMGYYRVGFEVYGIDNKPQPHYPFPFLLMDALEAMDRLLRGEGLTFSNGETLYLKDFATYHASPPCQRYSSGTPDKSKHPDLIDDVRKLLNATKKLWIIENVPGAPLRADIKIQGDMVGLTLIKRKRWFETNWFDSIVMPVCCERTGPVITVTGHGTTTGNRQTWKRNISTSEMRIAMDIDWMNRDELSQSIPPAYTEYIGKYLIKALMEVMLGKE